MSRTPRSEVTRILIDLCANPKDTEGTGRLLELVYEELREIAARIMRNERSGHTLQPTALVHEVYVKLVDQENLQWNDRAHFLSIAARAMRQILVDHARSHGAVKRGGNLQRVTMEEAMAKEIGSHFEMLALNDALDKLAAEDERAGRVAELRLFGGLTVKETAHVLDVSPRTVDDDWQMCRMWLSRELSDATE